MMGKTMLHAGLTGILTGLYQDESVVMRAGFGLVTALVIWVALSLVKDKPEEPEEPDEPCPGCRLDSRPHYHVYCEQCEEDRPLVLETKTLYHNDAHKFQPWVRG